jgi:hypothetical protein
MELACRASMREPAFVDPDIWPTSYAPDYAAATRRVLEKVFSMILAWIA